MWGGRLGRPGGGPGARRAAPRVRERRAARAARATGVDRRCRAEARPERRRAAAAPPPPRRRRAQPCFAPPPPIFPASPAQPPPPPPRSPALSSITQVPAGHDRQRQHAAGALPRPRLHPLLQLQRRPRLAQAGLRVRPRPKLAAAPCCRRLLPAPKRACPAGGLAGRVDGRCRPGWPAGSTARGAGSACVARPTLVHRRAGALISCAHVHPCPPPALPQLRQPERQLDVRQLARRRRRRRCRRPRGHLPLLCCAPCRGPQRRRAPRAWLRGPGWPRHPAVTALRDEAAAALQEAAAPPLCLLLPPLHCRAFAHRLLPPLRRPAVPQVTVRAFVSSPGATAATPTIGNPNFAGTMGWLRVRGARQGARAPAPCSRLGAAPALGRAAPRCALRKPCPACSSAAAQRGQPKARRPELCWPLSPTCALPPAPAPRRAGHPRRT